MFSRGSIIVGSSWGCHWDDCLKIHLRWFHHRASTSWAVRKHNRFGRKSSCILLHSCATWRQSINAAPVKLEHLRNTRRRNLQFPLRMSESFHHFGGRRSRLSTIRSIDKCGNFAAAWQARQRLETTWSRLLTPRKVKARVRRSSNGRLNEIDRKTKRIRKRETLAIIRTRTGRIEGRGGRAIESLWIWTYRTCKINQRGNGVRATSRRSGHCWGCL